MYMFIFGYIPDLTTVNHRQNGNRSIIYQYFQEVVVALEHVRTHEEYLNFMLPRLKRLLLEKPGQVLLSPKGAFYDFWNRLWLEDKRLRQERKRKLKKKRKKPKGVKKGQKLQDRRPGVVDRLVRSFRKGRFFPPSAPSGCLRSCSPGYL